MPVYVEVGPMGYTSDGKKADKKYADKAKARLQAAAEKAISGKFTISKKDVPRYVVRLHVDQVTVDAKGVSCLLGGELNQIDQTSKKKELLKGAALAGKGSIMGDNSEGAVYDCIAAAATTTMTKSIIPNLK